MYVVMCVFYVHVHIHMYIYMCVSRYSQASHAGIVPIFEGVVLDERTVGSKLWALEKTSQQESGAAEKASFLAGFQDRVHPASIQMWLKRGTYLICNYWFRARDLLRYDRGSKPGSPIHEVWLELRQDDRDAETPPEV